MIEQIMFFVLGLLTAGLIALMVAPAVWRRAVRLTRLRIERSVPMTLAEIQADKDQLRAEFAMSTRRLELTVERLKEKAAEQLVEINEKRELIARLSSEHSGRLDAVRALDQREAELREELRQREHELANANANLKSQEAKLADRSRAHAELEQQYARLRQSSEDQSVELAARTGEVEQLSASSTNTAEALQARIAEKEAELAAERLKAEKLQADVARFESERTAQVAGIDGRDREIGTIRTELEGVTAARAELERRLAEMEAARLDAETQIARLTLRLESESDKTPSEEVRRALGGMENEKAELEGRLATLAEERDQLRAENAELRRLAGDDWEAERMENALLRERLNDIATQVGKVTRTLAPVETGEPSHVEATPVRLPRARAVPEEGSAEKPAEGGPKSLADRIRALQRTSASG